MEHCWKNKRDGRAGERAYYRHKFVQSVAQCQTYAYGEEYDECAVQVLKPCALFALAHLLEESTLDDHIRRVQHQWISDEEVANE